MLSRGMQDGYSTATIQFITDEPVSDEQQIGMQSICRVVLSVEMTL